MCVCVCEHAYVRISLFVRIMEEDSMNHSQPVIHFFSFFNGYKLTHTCWWDVLLLLSIVQWRCIYKDFILWILQSKMWPNFPEIQIVALRMHPCQFHSLGPGSTHNGSVSWGDCGRAFLDEKHVSSFCWWVPTLCLDSIVSQTLTSTIVYACFVRK